jgi:murein DD-endopeptidase MepM/ murein hydrolase activator NlpD
VHTRALLILITLIFTACSGSTPEQVQSSPIQPDVVTPTEKTPDASATITPGATPTQLEVQITTPTSTSTATHTEFVNLCSPLEIHPLAELPEIIGDHYDPPRPGREERHHGIDFGYYHYQERDSMLGEPVQSVLAGQVASVLTGQYPYGNMVIVETDFSDIPPELGDEIEIPEGQSLYMLYAHLDQPPEVNLGDQLVACQSLGVVGMSGNTDIPHLHLETRWGPPGQVFESMRFYDTRATQAEMDAYVLWRTSGVFQHFDPLYLLAPGAIPTPTPEGF